MPMYEVAVPITGELWVRVRAETEHAAKLAAAAAPGLFWDESFDLGERFQKVAAEYLPGFAGENTSLFLKVAVPPAVEDVVINETLPDPPST